MIYCVEDERNIRELLVYTLETTGFEAEGFETGAELDTAMKKNLPELILLDIMLPGEDGYNILKRLKSDTRTRDIPVIMVTAKEAEFDKVKGLESGADDYITKPFGMMEFVARVKAVLRRCARQSEERELHCKGLRVNVSRHEVSYQGEVKELTRKEFELLEYLMENKGLVMSRNQILCHVWGYDFDGETRTVDVHVRTLRQKLGEAGNLIETVRGVGYRIGDQGEFWAKGVLDQIRRQEIPVSCRSGINRLRIYSVTPGFVLEKLLIRPEGTDVPESYLGPKETYHT